MSKFTLDDNVNNDYSDDTDDGYITGYDDDYKDTDRLLLLDNYDEHANNYREFDKNYKLNHTNTDNSHLYTKIEDKKSIIHNNQQSSDELMTVIRVNQDIDIDKCEIGEDGNPKYYVYVVFYKNDNSQRSWYKILLTRLTGYCLSGSVEKPRTHVEIIDMRNRAWGVSDTGKPIQPHFQKKFEKTGYEDIRKMYCSKTNYLKMERFLEKQVGKYFNRKAMIWNNIPLIHSLPCIHHIDMKGESYLCSELVCHTLMRGNMITDRDLRTHNTKPYLIPPDIIYKIILSHSAECDKIVATQQEENPFFKF